MISPARPGCNPRERRPASLWEGLQVSLSTRVKYLNISDITAHSRRRNELRQIGLAFYNFQSVFDYLPTIDGPSPLQPTSGLSWRVHLLPFLGESFLYKQFRLNEPWDSPHNKTLLTKMPKVFGNHLESKTRVHMLTGPGTPFQSQKWIKRQEIADEPGKVILVVEAGEETADFWTKPGGLKYDPAHPVQCLGSADFPQDKFFAVMIDESVLSFPLTIDPQVFRSMAEYPRP